MRLCFSLLLILAMSCSSKKAMPVKENNLQRVVNYLKKDFRVFPDVQRFDSFYLKELANKKKSLETDSLIASKIKINEYKPLNLNFILYDNYYRYRDRKREDYFTVYLIQDIKNGKFYTDFVNDKAGFIIEDYCSWWSRSMKIQTDSSKNITAKDAEAYNTIYTNRVFGEHESRLTQKHMGIQSYLNDAFHFQQPSSVFLDSLFNFYDTHIFTVMDTPMKSSNELFGFITSCANEINNEPDYGNRAKRLIYLKDQVNLLLLQTGTEQQNTYFRIYKSHRRLRVRSLLITGTATCGFSYFIDEYSMCF